MLRNIFVAIGFIGLSQFLNEVLSLNAQEYIRGDRLHWLIAIPQ